jgi:8-oxo-dGTP diphosphatase
MKEYVVGFAFDPTDTMVALIRKNRPSWQAGRLNGIGGKVERFEMPLLAMGREFREEVGDAPVIWRHFATLEGHDDSARIQDPEPFRVWLFRGVAASIVSRTDEPVAWFDSFALRASGAAPVVVPNLLWLVPMARSRQEHDWPFRIVERFHEVRA